LAGHALADAPALVAGLIEQASRHWPLAPDIEITLEANPSSVEAANFAALASAGINRVSLGLQALDDETLHFLGRLHNATEGSPRSMSPSAISRGSAST
jgi:oxygen-independent coproporphyrinogen-3 oxidase